MTFYIACLNYVPVNSKTAHPPARAIPEHLTRVELRTVGNLTQNEARPVGHLTFVSKRLSAVGNKRISQFFDSARAPRSRVIALVDSTWVFLLLSFLYRGICLCLRCGEMINRRIFKYKAFIMFTVLLEHLRAF